VCVRVYVFVGEIESKRETARVCERERETATDRERGRERVVRECV